MMLYEPKTEAPISTRAFIRRLMSHGLFVALLVGASIVIGVVGYHTLGDEAWLDGFVDTCMLLGGMGQVGAIRSTGGKVFSALYSLYAGLVFIVSLTALSAPVIHRIIHKFHWEPSPSRHAG